MMNERRYELIDAFIPSLDVESVKKFYDENRECRDKIYLIFQYIDVTLPKRKKDELLTKQPINNKKKFIVIWNHESVVYDIKKSVGITVIIKRCEEYNIKNLIIIYRTKITYIANNMINNYRTQEYKIQNFFEEDFYMDLTEHKEYFIPHVLCAKKKKEEILKDYNITEDQLPQLKLVTDPMCKFYGFKKGDLVKIVRELVTFSTYTMRDGRVKNLLDLNYRVVV
jgi:DNA-directed RNA polymerase subunit H (RpoH/RPB5)